MQVEPPKRRFICGEIALHALTKKNSRVHCEGLYLGESHMFEKNMRLTNVFPCSPNHINDVILEYRAPQKLMF
jgi:hypothetical protein